MRFYERTDGSSIADADVGPVHIASALGIVMERIERRARHRAIVEECGRPAEGDGIDERHDATADERGA